MLFVLTAIDKPGCVALRLSVREAHLAYVRETELLRLGGPLLNEAGEMTGSLLIVDAPDLAAVEAWHAADPYVKAGLFAASEIRPFMASFNPAGFDLTRLVR